MRVMVRMRPLVLFRGSLWEKRGKAAKVMVRLRLGPLGGCQC